MTTTAYANLVLTFLLEYNGRFLLVKRTEDEEHFAGLWAFPGGKVEAGETVVDALRREIDEETGVAITGDIMLLDAYCFGRSTGLAFLLKAANDRVFPDECDEYRWVETLGDLASLHRIPGIDNHLARAHLALAAPGWQRLDDIQLREADYLNQ